MSRAGGLGAGGIAGISAGLVFAAVVFPALAHLAAGLPVPAAVVAVVVAGLLALLPWSAFSELSGMFPSGAGIRIFMRRSMPDRPALVISLAYLLTIVLVMAADAYVVVRATHSLPGVPDGTGVVAMALIVVGAVSANLLGVRPAARLQLAGTVTVLAGACTLSVMALLRGRDQGERVVASLTPGSFLAAVVIGIFLYSAFEWATTSVEEAREPSVVPRGMLIALILLCLTFALTVAAMGTTLTSGQLLGSEPQIHLGRVAAGEWGAFAALGLTLLTAVNTFNGGLLVGSRFLYALARERKLPRSLTVLNARLQPRNAILLLAAAVVPFGVLVAVTGSVSLMIEVGAVFEAFIFAVAGFCVLRLRSREPDRPRPFRMWAARPLGICSLGLFGLLAGGSALTLDGRPSPAPLLLTVLVFLVAVMAVRLGSTRSTATATARPPAPVRTHP